jgi:hypothetical protein
VDVSVDVDAEEVGSKSGTSVVVGTRGIVIECSIDGLLPAPGIVGTCDNVVLRLAPGGAITPSPVSSFPPLDPIWSIWVLVLVLA